MMRTWYVWHTSKLSHILHPHTNMIGASLSKPHTDELNGGVYIYNMTVCPTAGPHELWLNAITPVGWLCLIAHLLSILQVFVYASHDKSRVCVACVHSR